jgi:phospho-N-acetylmuramoyl-pentapeptide-transferase
MKMGLVDFIPVVIFIIAVSNGANLTDGMDVGCRNFGSISVALGIFRFKYNFSNYLNIMYIPNSGK